MANKSDKQAEAPAAEPIVADAEVESEAQRMSFAEQNSRSFGPAGEKDPNVKVDNTLARAEAREADLGNAAGGSEPEAPDENLSKREAKKAEKAAQKAEDEAAARSRGEGDSASNLSQVKSAELPFSEEGFAEFGLRLEAIANKTGL